MRVLFELDFAGVESENGRRKIRLMGARWGDSFPDAEMEFGIKLSSRNNTCEKKRKEVELHTGRCQSVTRPHKTSAHILGSSGARTALLRSPE